MWKRQKGGMDRDGAAVVLGTLPILISGNHLCIDCFPLCFRPATAFSALTLLVLLSLV